MKIGTVMGVRTLEPGHLREPNIIKIKFPIQELPGFLRFENTIQVINEEIENEEGKIIEYSGMCRQKALVSLFRGWVNKGNTWKECIKKCFKQMLHKDVQKLYSGKGRRTSQKESFRVTTTYECLRDFLSAKFPSSGIDIIQYVGYHLSEANRHSKGE